MAMKNRWRTSSRTTPLLWEFLVSLLQDKDCRDIIRWTDESTGTFRIVDSYQVATLWGEIKGRPKMDQNKLRRAIRQYYKSGVMKKVKGQKGGYKFENLPYDPFKNEKKDTRQEVVSEKSYKLADKDIEKDLENLLDTVQTTEEPLTPMEEDDADLKFERWMEEQKSETLWPKTNDSGDNVVKTSQDKFEIDDIL